MISAAQEPVSDKAWWLEDAPLSPVKRNEIDKHCDVAIIGAGYTGLTAALTLAKAGKSVQVFEKGWPGEGASTRNGGITSGSLRFRLSAAVKAFGEAKGIGIHHEAMEARTHLGQLIRDNDIACDYQLNGLFTGSITDADFELQKRELNSFNELLGTNHRIVEKSDLPSLIKTDRYSGGILRTDIGSLHPAKFLSGLLAAAIKDGACVHCETPVVGVQRYGTHFKINTERGSCMAQDVVVATNGYGDAFDPWLQRRLVPVTSRVIVTEELPEKLVGDLIPGGTSLGEKKKLYNYFRSTPDGRCILFGGREPAWTRDRSIAINQLFASMIRVFPALQEAKISHSWAGNVAFSRTQLPMTFKQDGVHYAVGYCGSGTVWAPWLGHKTALKLLGDPAGVSRFDAVPPKSIPLFEGKPWFLPAFINGYQLIDHFKGRN